MKCKVDYVYKNFRYNLLEIDGEHYIVDKDRPFFMFFFPFFHWIFPFTIFKINNEVSPEQLKVPIEKRQKSVGKKGAIGGGIIVLGTSVSLTLADWLSSVVHFFGTDAPTKLNVIVFSVIFSVILLLRFYFNKFNKKILSKQIDLEKLETRRVWIRPTSFRQFSTVVFGYVLIGFFAVATGYIFIEEGNIMFLLFSICLTCFVLLLNIAVVMVGTTKVKFWRDKQ